MAASLSIKRTVCHKWVIILENQSEAGETVHNFDNFMFSYFYTCMFPYKAKMGICISKVSHF